MSKEENLGTSKQMYFFASPDVDKPLSLEVRCFLAIKSTILLLPLAHKLV